MLPQEALTVAGVQAVGEAGSWGRSINNETSVSETQLAQGLRGCFFVSKDDSSFYLYDTGRGARSTVRLIGSVTHGFKVVPAVIVIEEFADIGNGLSRERHRFGQLSRADEL